MSFFKKLFGGGKDAQRFRPVAKRKGEPIKVFDKYGREMFIEREDWIDSVLNENLKQAWNDPQALYNHIAMAFGDGFFEEVEDATQHLADIDTEKDRGATMLAILFLQTERPAKAERVLEEFVADHGEDGVILTNLAKAQTAQGRDEESLKTLWRALELDPNQENGLGWYEVIHRENSGHEAGLEAIRRVAAIPGSWRAQLWLARHALENQQLEVALGIYRDCLATAERLVPTDLLRLLTGDLGNNGHLTELIELGAPHFDVSIHGLEVGNNLIKSYVDTGQLDLAHHLLQQLQVQQRPDWKESLAFWETELAKARLSTQDTVTAEGLKISMLTVAGPLWLKPEHPTAEFFPAKAIDATTVAVLGCSHEPVIPVSEIVAQPSDHSGRMSRAIPMYLCERLYLKTDARSITLIPWVLNEGGGFAVSAKESSDEDLAIQARQVGGTDAALSVPDFAVNAHLVTRGENWSVQVRVIRTIDAACLGEFVYDFAENAFQKVADCLFEAVCEVLLAEADVEKVEMPTPTSLSDGELDHYLFRLEQTFAVRCSLMDNVGSTFLSNPAEIIEGLVHLGLQNPKNVPARLMLWRALDGVAESDAELVNSFREKVDGLMEEFPLEGPIQALVVHELTSVFGD